MTLPVLTESRAAHYRNMSIVGKLRASSSRKKYQTYSGWTYWANVKDQRGIVYSTGPYRGKAEALAEAWGTIAQIENVRGEQLT